MSVIVMKRKFEAPPSKDDILELMTGNNFGDKGKAKEALINILAPMKDILAALSFIETLDTAATQYAALLQEQDATQKAIDDFKVKTAAAKKSYDVAVKKVAEITSEIADLETKLTAVAAEIVQEQEAKLRVNKAVADEYDKLRKEMLAKVAADEKVAQKSLETIQANIATAQAELDALAEKKRAFIASLTA